MAEINCSNKTFTQGAEAITLNGYSALNDMDRLLHLATPVGYSEDLKTYTFNTDEEGARAVASYLSEGIDALGDAVDSIGYLLCVADDQAIDGSDYQLRGIGSALLLIANTLRASKGGMENIADYADALARQRAAKQEKAA